MLFYNGEDFIALSFLSFHIKNNAIQSVALQRPTQDDDSIDGEADLNTWVLNVISAAASPSAYTFKQSRVLKNHEIIMIPP